MTKEKRFYHIWVDDETCKSCGLCIANCPKQILQFSKRLNKQGLNPMECMDQDRCIGCLSCAEICPEVAIQVTASSQPLKPSNTLLDTITSKAQLDSPDLKQTNTKEWKYV